MAQLGSAPALGAGGRRFKSCRPDQKIAEAQGFPRFFVGEIRSDWRSRGVGPRAYRFGKHLKFAVTDVTAWIEAQRGADPTTAALLEKAFGR